MTTSTNQRPLRSLDPDLPNSPPQHQALPPIDLERLPLPCQRIPPHVSSLQECALWQIQTLLAKTTSLTEEDEDAIDDGFVLCDLSVVRRKLQVWRQQLFPTIKPFFAVKCNPDVMVTAVLGQFTQDVGFDCASLAEIRLALESSSMFLATSLSNTTSSSTSTGGATDQTYSSNTKRCLYANPQRAERDLDVALALGVNALTFDGPEELHKVHRAHQKRVAASSTKDNVQPPLAPEMILRILVPDATSTVPLGEKFGAPPERVESLATEAVKLKLPIVGVSFHCGSGCHDPAAYCEAIGLAKDAMEVVDRVQAPLGIQCQLLDIGGGYPGFDGSKGEYGRFVGKMTDCVALDTTSDEETTASIASAVMPLVNKLFPPETSHVQIISEPGRYFVEAAYAVCSRIYSIRIEKDENGGQSHRHYYIAQGVQGVFKDVMLCGEEFVPLPLKMEESQSENVMFCTSTVHGPASEDFDIVCRDLLLPVLEVGDWLIFDRMGAYTLSIAARSGRLPIRHVMGSC